MEPMHDTLLVNTVRDSHCRKAFTTSTDMQTRGVIISCSQMVTKINRHAVPRDTGTCEGAGREGASAQCGLAVCPAGDHSSSSHPLRTGEADGLPSACTQAVHDQQLPPQLLQAQFGPQSWLLPSGARILYIQEAFVNGWLHKGDFLILSCRCCFSAHLTVDSLL